VNRFHLPLRVTTVDDLHADGLDVESRFAPSCCDRALVCAAVAGAFHP
jgi:hypothetical protein